jgi:hypothetical protein
MYKSLAYKEWLKIRWFTLGAFALEVVVLIYIFSNLRAVVEFNSAVSLWNVIIYNSYMFFDSIKYIPLLIAIVIGVAQYTPEVLQMKLKLTLHLPLKEKNIYVFLNMFGTAVLAALFIPIFILLLIGSSSVFPSEIIYATILTIIPWFLAAFLAYYFIAAILIEPLWTRRVLIISIAVILINPFFYGAGYGAYQLILLPLFIFTLLFSYLSLFPGLRFKRGAK